MSTSDPALIAGAHRRGIWPARFGIQQMAIQVDPDVTAGQMANFHLPAGVALWPVRGGLPGIATSASVHQFEIVPQPPACSRQAMLGEGRAWSCGRSPRAVKRGRRWDSREFFEIDEYPLDKDQ